LSIDVQGVPLKTTLRIGLEQIGLHYRIQDGYLRVTNMGNPGELDSLEMIAHGRRWNQPASLELTSDLDNSFLIAGHCLLALLAAGIGAILAPLVAEPRVPSASSPEHT
jgi:hypothetical protein